MVLFFQDVVKRCQQGDRIAQRQLFEQLYAPLYRVSYRYVGQQAEAEDCLMRGLMKAFQKLDTFHYENEYSLFAWVRKIVVNEVLMALRKERTFSMVPVDDHVEVPDLHPILEQMAAEELYQLITQLPVGYRTVFNLFVVEGYSHQEIAGMLGISEVTSRTQLAKSKQKLRTLLTQLYQGYESTGTGE